MDASANPLATARFVGSDMCLSWKCAHVTSALKGETHETCIRFLLRECAFNACRHNGLKPLCQGTRVVTFSVILYMSMCLVKNKNVEILRKRGKKVEGDNALVMFSNRMFCVCSAQRRFETSTVCLLHKYMFYTKRNCLWLHWTVTIHNTKASIWIFNKSSP